MKIKFFHTPKPKQYNYKPRFYDPRKEHFDKVRTSSENPDAAEAAERMRERLGKLKERENIARRSRNSTRNLIVAIAVLAMLLYFIMK